MAGQCGRNRVPVVAAPIALRDWLEAAAPSVSSSGAGLRLLLSLAPDALPLLHQPGLAAAPSITLLSGLEGGLGPAEEALAL